MNNTPKVIQNSVKAWLLAMRPKTLSGAFVPVAIGIALAASRLQLHIDPLPAILCVLFALTMQIDANFVNDYFDWRRGNDDPATRLGPLRACSMGWVTPSAMLAAIVITTIVACVIGLPLVLYGGVEMIMVGLACVVFCILYTTTLSYIAFGDVLVVAFFGVVPVTLTYYLQVLEISQSVLWVSLACGLSVDTLLIVNNYRDIDNDRRDRKITLVVIVGKNAARILYLALGVISSFIIAAFDGFSSHSIVMLIYLVPHILAFRQMALKEGRQLNNVLAITARNIMLFGIATTILILL